MQTLLEFSPARDPLVYTAETPVPGQLPIELRVATVDVAQAAGLSPNALRLFNGSAATYADIRGGLTIPRAVEGRLKNTLNERGKRVLVVTGVAGVGKSTLARRLLYSRMGGTSFCWEHQQTFPFDYEPWLRVEAVLRDQGLTGTLLIDDCVAHLAAVNRLADHLGDLERSSLKLIVTANSIQWQPRTKSPAFFRRGWTETLSRLLDADLEQLVNLIYQQPEIRVLVEQSFAQLPRAEQLDRLRDRCSAEMYVCLKNIFGSDRLDDILLREFAELDEAQRDVYRHVAALEAMGSRVHRQLIIRLLGLDAGTLKAQLTLLQGIVDEFDVKPRDGLYGWATRHAVIAETIATYKYADQGELDGLLERLIDGLNPAVWLEVDTARQICISDLGINRLSDRLEQLRLLRKLCDVVPGERIPRRRLVRKLLDLDLWDDAARAIANARRELGGDAVIDRYRVVLAIRRAQNTEGILDEDRLAMLQEATRLALACIVASPRDKHAYRVYGEVGVAIARMTKDTSVLDDAIGRIAAAEEDILDPQLAEYRRQFESTRRRLYIPSPVAAPVPVPGIGEADDA